MPLATESNTLSLEHELVLELVQFRNPNKERVLELLRERLDLAEILGHLCYNRLSGLAWHTLRSIAAPTFNREFELCISLLYDIQSHRIAAHRKYITRISEVLRTAGIPHAFLKGAILANSTYPTGCRISSDIDILMRSDDLTACGQVLNKIGFIQGDYDENTKQVKPATRRDIFHFRMNFGEVKPYLMAVNEPGIQLVEVDINFSLDWMAIRSKEPVDNFIHHAEDYRFGGTHQVSSLPKEYFLAHLCVHLYKEAAVLNWVNWQRDLNLYKFVDIYAFLTDPNIRIDWDKLQRVAEDNGIKNEVYYSLQYTLIFFPRLADIAGFQTFMQAIKPSDSSYLQQVVDPTNTQIKYEWSSDLITRFFDMKRYDSLRRLEG